MFALHQVTVLVIPPLFACPLEVASFLLLIKSLIFKKIVPTLRWLDSNLSLSHKWQASPHCHAVMFLHIPIFEQENHQNYFSTATTAFLCGSLILWWSFLQVLCSSIIQLVASYFKTHLARNFFVMAEVETTVPKLLSFLSSLHPVYQQSWPPGMPVHTPLLSDWCFFQKFFPWCCQHMDFHITKALW